MKRAIPPQGSAAEAGSPERLWSLQIGKNRQSLQKHSERPVPCEQGAADKVGGAPDADPPFGPHFCNLCCIHFWIELAMDY